MAKTWNAFLLVSFGGPERNEDVIPFLENVLRGKNVPRERLLEVAEHYYQFGGVSPLNEQCRQLIAALETEFASHGISLPIYWGNRNWHPLLPDTVRQMRDNGVRRAIAFVTSAFGSYSGCRQYRENIESARSAVANAPLIDQLPPFWNHPGFIETMVARVRDAQQQLPGGDLIFTAHSIPVSMARSSPYERQLREACSMVSARVGAKQPVLVFQSRSGPPSQPWLGPDIGDYLRQTESKRIIVAPIGFLSDHMEVIYDLDTEAAAIAAGRGIEMIRAKTVGTHPRFVRAILEMVQDAMAHGLEYECAGDCCETASRPAAAQAPAASDAPLNIPRK